MNAAVEDYRWLVSDRAEPLLVRVAADVRENPATPAQIRALRTEVGVERAALVLEQVELRRRAREKFPEADQLFFIRRGLEQATDARLATYKAFRFAVANDLADLCCGIGGDAMTLALDHPIRLVDRDEVALILAVANIGPFGPDLRAVCGSVAPEHVADVNAWHLDPDRRASGQRTSRAEFSDPGLELIEQLRTANPHGAIKLAPAAMVPETWRMEGEREWIETRGECRQQMIWLGDFAEIPGSSIATIVEEDDGEAASFRGSPEIPLHSGDAVGKYVFDPAPSLIAAHLTGAWRRCWS